MPIFIEVKYEKSTISINISHIKEFYAALGNESETTIVCFIDQTKRKIDEPVDSFRQRVNEAIYYAKIQCNN